METKPLSVEALRQNANAKKPLVVLDVRDEAKFQTGSLQLDGIPLVHCPYAAMLEHDSRLSELLAELPANAQVVTVCTSGNKAEKAAALLREQGLAAQSLQGGLTAWRERENAK